MPLIKIEKDGQVGYKFGESGKEFFGEGAKEKAEAQGRAIKASEFKDRLFIFKDNIATFQDKDSKRTVISIRDGVHEYLGMELGLEPVDKVFTVFRSPETVKNIAPDLIDLPLSDEHLDFDKLPKHLEQGKILTSQIKEFQDDATSSTIFVENEILLDDNMVELVSDGKDELSLDYSGNLIPHDKFDFEQVDIKPKFLAIVSKGRCGSQCKFQDQKGVTNMEEILKMIKELSDEDRTKLISKLAPVKKDTEDADKEQALKDAKDEGEEEGIKKGEEKFKDSQAFKDAMINFADERVSTIEKAKTYLAKDYDYKGKDNLAIMKDALTAEKSDVEFKDCEVGVAFKMLPSKEATSEMKEFADSEKETVWTKLEKEEL